MILGGQVVGSGGNLPNPNPNANLPPPASPYGGQQQQQQQQHGGPPPGVYGAPPPQQSVQQQQQHQQPPFNAYEQPQHNPYGGASASSSSGYAAPAYQQPPAAGPYGAQTNSRPVVRDEAVGNITPIGMLNPYGTKWTIKARVTAKSEIRKWSNARGEGTLFSIDLLDADNGEIRGTFFKEAVDKWYTQIDEQSVYTFSNGKLKVVTNKAFTSIKNNYEITFDTNSDIRPCPEDAAIKTTNYSFTKLDQIESVEINSTLDVLGVIRYVGWPAWASSPLYCRLSHPGAPTRHPRCHISTAGDIGTVITKATGKELRKRDLVIHDDTGVEVRLTVWGDKAENNEFVPGHVIVVKGARVGDFQGRSLSLINSSTMALNPPIPEAEAMYHQCAAQKEQGVVMRSLATGGGMDRGMEPLVGRHTLASIRDDPAMGRGKDGKPDYATVKVPQLAF